MKVKVIVAYCVEIGEVISIGEAQMYFAAQRGIKKRFHFTCSDSTCGIPITGVNYDKITQDGKKFVSPHFRSHVSHSPNCEWVLHSNEIHLSKKSNETNEEYTDRKAISQLCDHIDYFIPNKSTSIRIKHQLTVSTDTPNRTRELVSPPNINSTNYKRYITTSLLKRLTDYWLDCKKKLSPHRIRKLKITIEDVGRMPLYRYIKHLTTLTENNTNGVYYCGAKNQIKRYGAGFSMSFMDKLNDMPTNLYIDKSLMEHRLSHYINAVINEKQARYFKVFLLNPIIKQKNFNNGKQYISLTVETLDHLSIYYEE